MGYWEQSEEGVSFAGADRDPVPLMWGDQPADIVDSALWRVRAVFLKDLGRLPSVSEIMAGLTFSTRNLDLPNRPEDSPYISEEDLAIVDENYYAAVGGDTPRTERQTTAVRKINDVINRLSEPFSPNQPES